MWKVSGCRRRSESRIPFRFEVRRGSRTGNSIGSWGGRVALAAGLVISSSLIGLPNSSVLGTDELAAQTLRGGQASLDRQNRQAQLHNFSYLRTPEEVTRFVELGYLVPIVPTRDLDLHNVSYPYARPEVRVFLDRLSQQYRAACGEKLVVTSLTRPISNQPRNASSRSVHPTGMAVDLRRSGSATCRSWLESTLLSLEGRGVIEAIYERNPPHYHLAVYPTPYIQYVAEITGNDRIVEELDAGPAVEVEWVRHTVRGGETLTLIASRYGAALARIQAENGIQGSRINVGQVLRIPVYQTVPSATPTQQPATRVAEASSTAEASTTAEPTTEQGVPGTGEVESGDRTSATLDGSSDSSDDVDGPGAASGVDASPRTRVHQVARGESIWAIARSYGVSELDLRRENGLTGTRIVVGQELTIPSGGSSSPSGLTAGVGEQNGGIVQHEVRRGESLWVIANLHGVTVDALRDANGLRSGSIHPGQVLEVPSGR
ncbi:MAG: LysM peptidoglycan-binding domain-containing protein [Gemmatimonadales bacterium]|nr:MAG: LysM peptidoglycan-binding domain-containing protein [Gemmatimonadales bacterium]